MTQWAMTQRFFIFICIFHDKEIFQGIYFFNEDTKKILLLGGIKKTQIRDIKKAKNSPDDQKSPIFLQFLDCVHQIFHQYPLSFEFTTRLLNDIAYYLYSCYFGTFLMDTIIVFPRKKPNK